MRAIVMSEEFNTALIEMDALIRSVNCVMLGSTSSKGAPHSSYAPVHVDADRRFYVYLSSMAKHAAYIRRSGVASAMLIEDESGAANLFARKRLTVDCDVQVLERDTAEWTEGISKMEKTLGETMGYLKSLIDFDLFLLSPREGRLVLGFGKAYDVFGRGLREIDYVGGGGHRQRSP